MKGKEIVKFITKSGVTIAFLGLALASLGGCAEEIAHATPTDTIPVVNQTIKPTSTPTSKPSPTPTVEFTNTPSPTPTPILELSYEEEVKLLGVTTKDKTIKISQYDGIYYEIPLSDGSVKKRIVFVYSGRNRGETLTTYKNAWDDKTLFKSKKSTDGLFLWEIEKDGFVSQNTELKDAVVKKYFSLDKMKSVFKELGIEWVDSKYYDYIVAGGMGTYLDKYMSIDDFIALYLTHVPKEYRQSASEIDERIEDVPLTPTALPSPTVQQSSRQYNGFGYETFTSKDGAAQLNYRFKRNEEQKIVDKNVIEGYKTDNYYNNANKFIVDAINHPQYGRVKI